MNKKRPRVLLVTRNLPPLVGGMERLNWHIADELSNFADVRVVGPKGSARYQPEKVHIDEVPLRPLWLFLVSALMRSLFVARKWRPDVVLAGSGLMAPAVLIAARTSGARAAVYTHGLDVTARHPLYRAIWQPAIRKIETVIANSSPTKKLLSGIEVDESRVQVINPGVSLPAEFQPVEELQQFRDKFSLGNGPIILSVGRFTRRKGLLEFVSYSLHSVVKVHPDLKLVVIGEEPLDALQANVQSRKDIQAAAMANGVEKNLVFTGHVSERTLACAFEAAAVHVFPVRSTRGDPEGFGMVAIEAAAHGLPTVAFASGGVVDAVADGQSGYLVPEGQYDSFANSVLRIISDGKHSWMEGAVAFSAKFAWPEFGQQMGEALALNDHRLQQETRKHSLEPLQ